ncbi:MAG: hypothetical protein WCJ13_07725 [Coriobacteriia bacterium]
MKGSLEQQLEREWSGSGAIVRAGGTFESLVFGILGTGADAHDA